MGNRLTVANATDRDIYVSVDVDEMAVTDIKTDLGMQQFKPTADVTYDMKPTDIKLGSVAIASGKSLKFAKIASKRYFMTITAKSWTDLVCQGLQIPWRKNVIVTPDVKVAFAKSGTIWVDESDGTDYTPKHVTGKSGSDGVIGDKGAGSGKKALDSIDGSVVTDPGKISVQEAVISLKQLTGLPKYVIRLFLSQVNEEMSADDLNSLATDVVETKRLLSEKVASDNILLTVADEGKLKVDEKTLKELLQREPFNMHESDVELVISELLATEKRQLKTSQLLHQLHQH